MDKQDFFRLLNKGKRSDYYLPQKKKGLKTLLIELYSYTGKVIKNRVEELTDKLKTDLYISFQPTKKFTKKDLQGVDMSTLYMEEQIRLQEKEIKKENVKRSKDGKTNVVYDYFGKPYVPQIIEPKIQEKPPKRVTLLKANGKVVGLDDFDDF